MIVKRIVSHTLGFTRWLIAALFLRCSFLVGLAIGGMGWDVLAFTTWLTVLRKKHRVDMLSVSFLCNTSEGLVHR